MVEESAGDAQPAIRAAEFFAGIGLVREALEPLGVEVVWANDIEKAKRDAYAANHDAAHFQLEDVREVRAIHLPPNVELATSSFPCIDLSLAGNRRGLVGSQSGMFWEFARVLEEMQDQSPRVVLLENVHGFATSHGGKDLADALARLSELGYSCDVFAVDARHFVPQSRPRMFIAGVRGGLPPEAQTGIPPLSDVRPAWVQRVHAEHQHLRMHYLPLPRLPLGPQDLSEVVEKIGEGDSRWWGHDRVSAFVESLSPLQAARMEALRDSTGISWRTAYRRTRKGVAVWELRRDAIGGCLRTTGGGSSKQALVELGRGEIRVRWMTPLEYARMMGAGSYKLSGGTPNQALFGFGDAVVVDVIRWIGQHYLLPVLRWHKVPQAA
ncbi:DNA (cytosine-5-)-methyltransferase [Micromonospora sp. NPDC000207]|uniref:DNA cytosine methyltransferase n=1 Tax=Micromonospora sp. NPDC000207 TaxID=3154246 RepID=UPI00331FCE02